jgi:hypothetical protein
MAPAASVGAIALLIGAAAAPVCAQDAASGATQRPSWLLPELANARNEGSLTVYSSMNEQEGLPLWKMFEDATGVKVNYVRSSDSIILSRIAIENRARQRSWDLAVTTTVNRLPDEALRQFDRRRRALSFRRHATPTAAGMASTPTTTPLPTTPIWSENPSCRRATTNSSSAGNGPARLPSMTPMTNG